MSRVDDLSTGDRERYLRGAWWENAARRALGQAPRSVSWRTSQAMCTPIPLLAILLPKGVPGYVASVRVPAGRSLSAAEYCRLYETGGGRKLAAGIDADGFVQRFEASFGVRS